MHRVGFFCLAMVITLVMGHMTLGQIRLPELRHVEIFKTTKTQFEKLYDAPVREIGTGR